MQLELELVPLWNANITGIKWDKATEPAPTTQSSVAAWPSCKHPVTHLVLLQTSNVLLFYLHILTDIASYNSLICILSKVASKPPARDTALKTFDIYCYVDFGRLISF